MGEKEREREKEAGLYVGSNLDVKRDVCVCEREWRRWSGARLGSATEAVSAKAKERESARDRQG